MNIEYGKLYGIFTYDNQARLDIGIFGVKEEVPASHNSWATRLVIRRLDGESKGPVDSTHKVGIFSEDGKFRLDLGTDAMKKQIPVTHDSWATRLIFKKLNGESKGTVNYGDIVGVFSENNAVRLDIGKRAMKKEVPASHVSSATQLRIDLSDPIVDFEIHNIEYDVEKAVISSTGNISLYRQTVRNFSDVEQTTSIIGNESVTESSGWTDSLGFKFGAKTSFKTGIPFVAEGSIEVSTELSNTYEWNGSTEKSKLWGFDTSIKVPPHEVGTVLVSVFISTIVVPYKMDGNYVYKSGRREKGSIDGIYTGTNSSDLSVSYTFLNKEEKTVSLETVVL